MDTKDPRNRTLGYDLYLKVVGDNIAEKVKPETKHRTLQVNVRKEIVERFFAGEATEEDRAVGAKASQKIDAINEIIKEKTEPERNIKSMIGEGRKASFATSVKQFGITPLKIVHKDDQAIIEAEEKEKEEEKTRKEEEKAKAKAIKATEKQAAKEKVAEAKLKVKEAVDKKAAKVSAGKGKGKGK